MIRVEVSCPYKEKPRKEEKQEYGGISLFLRSVKHKGAVIVPNKVDYAAGVRIRGEYLLDKILIADDMSDEYIVLLGGPLSSNSGKLLNSSSNVKFIVLKDERGSNLVQMKVLNSSWIVKKDDFGKKDYGVVVLINMSGKQVLWVAGCTRYGTYAAALMLVSRGYKFNTELIVVEWVDLNENNRVETFECKILLSDRR